MQSVLIVIHLMVVIALAVLVLLQRSEGGGLGMGGGNPGSFMTGRGQANLLTRATAILGAAFFATSLILTIIAANSRGPKSILDTVQSQSGAPAQQGGPPAAPAAPGSVLDQLRGGQPAPAPAPKP